MHHAQTALRWPRLLAILLLCTTVRAADPAPIPAPINAADYTPPIRVACLGDSITAGVGAKTGWAWPDQLDRMLGEKWDVRNFGHSGATVGKDDKHTIWSQKEYRNALLFHPDVVIIMLGTNDTKPQNWKAKQDFPKLYKELVHSFQRLSSKPRVFCCTPPYVGKKGNFGINEAGVIEQLPMIRQIAQDWGAGVIDVHAALDSKDALLPDNVHPNTDGATLIAKTVYQALAGKPWQGTIPGPSEVQKSKPVIREVEQPGELTYREAFALIAAEANMPRETLDPIREKYEELLPVVETKILEYENKILEYDQLRMKYKHATDSAEQPLYGLYKGKVAELRKQLERYKRDTVYALIGLVPAEYREGVGAAWVSRYVLDRLTPIALTLSPQQRKQIRDLCRKEGKAYGNINNTPERSIADAETYGAVYQQVLTPEQKRRVEPQ